MNRRSSGSDLRSNQSNCINQFPCSQGQLESGLFDFGGQTGIERLSGKDAGWDDHGNGDAPEVLDRGTLQRLDPARLQLNGVGPQHKFLLTAVVERREPCEAQWYNGRKCTKTVLCRTVRSPLGSKFGVDRHRRRHRPYSFLPARSRSTLASARRPRLLTEALRVLRGVGGKRCDFLRSGRRVKRKLRGTMHAGCNIDQDGGLGELPPCQMTVDVPVVLCSAHHRRPSPPVWWCKYEGVLSQI